MDRSPPNALPATLPGFLDALRSGSNRFLGDLVATYDRPLRDFFRRRIRDRDLEDDLVQAVWILMYQRRAQFRGRDPIRRVFQAWLLRLARTAYWRWRRSEKVSLPLDLIGAIPEPESDSQGRLVDAIAVKDCLARLPVRQQVAARSFYMEGRSVRAIAQSMGCRPGTVQALLFKARRGMRQMLGSPAPPPPGGKPVPLVIGPSLHTPSGPTFLAWFTGVSLIGVNGSQSKDWPYVNRSSVWTALGNSGEESSDRCWSGSGGPVNWAIVVILPISGRPAALPAGKAS
jgi:RNA polymerase sigma factor (sigma-70 family)